MSIRLRQYNGSHDYELVGKFLVEHYKPGNEDGNWLQPAWEYMHGHPYLDKASLGKIGIWEEDGMMVGLAHYESRLGEAFLEFHPDYRYLKRDMLDYTERTLYGISNDGKKYLHAYAHELDEDLISLVKACGYEKDEEGNRPIYKFDISEQFPSIALPEGFRLKSLAEDCNWAKIHRVIWRGFDHEGEPPAGEEELKSRRQMFDTPSARRDLKIVVEGPEGDFVSFCGMFYESTRKYAYVEPVATDPDYRRLGLGKAAVLEGIRRCGALGATVAYVGSDQEFYKAIGFKKVFNSECWVKFIEDRS
jgi:GNAT superfamily N-acetyltransferase